MTLAGRPIYLDDNARTPIDPRIAVVLCPLLDGPLANPSASHPDGRIARSVLDRARAQVADLLGCEPHEIVFTSGGSEADDVVLNGHPSERLPNTLDVSYVGRVGAEVLAALDGAAASTGAACHADPVELSPVLRATGVPPMVGMGAVRLSLGRMTTEAEVDEVLWRCEGLA
jgi:cysteine sulfinate desulfinase/cysteine desulfurase-like protein